MFNSNSHLIADLAHMRREELMRSAAENRRLRLLANANPPARRSVRAGLGDWLIAIGQRLNRERVSLDIRQVHSS